MDNATRSQTALGRGNHYFYTMRTVMFMYLGLAAILTFSNAEQISLVIQVIAIAAAIYAVLAGDSALKDVGNLRDDMDDTTKASNYGKGALKTPYLAFRAISAIVNIVVAVVIVISA
jgi:hypothetical protein